MQFLPKGAMNNVVPIYHYVNEANGLRRIKVGSAWKRRRQMTMRIDIYRDRMHEYDTYRTSDGQVFMPLIIPMQEFLDLGTRETEMGYAEANTDEEWAIYAWDVLCDYVTKHAEFFVDDFWRNTGLEEPREARALGPLVQRRVDVGGNTSCRRYRRRPARFRKIFHREWHIL